MYTKINLDGIEVNYVGPGPDRIFRDAWVLNQVELTIDLDLDKLKPIAIKQINDWRDLRNEDPIQFAGTWYDCDEVSKSAKNVSGAAAVATLDMISGRNQFSVQWSTHFDGEVVFDAVTMTGLGVTMATRTGQLYVLARRLKQDIKDAESVNEVMAVLGSRDAIWPAQVPTE